MSTLCLYRSAFDLYTNDNAHVAFFMASACSFLNALSSVKERLERGNDVIVYYRARVHKAAQSLCLFLMYLLGMSFEDARCQLERIRPVKLDEIIHGRTRPSGTNTEDHMDYMFKWTMDVQRRGSKYRLLIGERLLDTE